MPHLSPMNWMLAIVMMWTMLALITSSMWWYTSLNLKTKVNKSSQQTSQSWLWNL